MQLNLAPMKTKKKVQSIVVCGKCAEEFASPLTTFSFKSSGTIGWGAVFWLNSVHTWIPCSLSIPSTFRPQNFTSFVFVLYTITWRLEVCSCNWLQYLKLPPLLSSITSQILLSKTPFCSIDFMTKSTPSSWLDLQSP